MSRRSAPKSSIGYSRIWLKCRRKYLKLSKISYTITTTYSQVCPRQVYCCSFGGANLTNFQTGWSGGSVQRARPYRNKHLISVISALYFSNGATSFASQFHQLFPTFDLPDGTHPEVPIPMIALVGTAVSAPTLNELAEYLRYLSALCRST
jgi:hypothetical protein